MRIIGLAGRAGAGKNAVAECLPGFGAIGFADPIYAGLAIMLDVFESELRSRETKERPIEWLGRSPRELAQTLGTDWGRGLVADDLWVRLCHRRIADLAMAGRAAVVITDVRFPNEVAMIRSLGGEVWLVERPGASIPLGDHVSEHSLAGVQFDRVIVNDGTLAELAGKVRKAVDAADA